MIDFKEIDKTGINFELLVREIFIKLNFEVKWSGVGPDRGKDLLVTENIISEMGNTKATWLVQCKHNANSGKSVGLEDIGDFVSACHDHNVNHYLLVCSTQLSSSVIERFENISTNQKINIAYWDSTKLERILKRIDYFDLFQIFFPISSKSSEIEIFATPSPNEWIFIYKGYYIILENRVMSSSLNWSHVEVKKIIEELNSIEKTHLTKHELLMPRKIWYNGKSPEFIWYIDYLYDSYHIKGSSMSKHPDELKYLLEDGYVRSDGQAYHFEINPVPASFSSDHFHENHYDYYEVVSKIRAQDFSFNKKIYVSEFKRLNSNIQKYLKDIASAISSIGLFRVLNIREDCTKEIFNMSANINWDDIFYEKNIDSSSDFFGPRLIISTEQDEKLFELFSGITDKVTESQAYFDLVKRYIYGGEISVDDYTFDIKFRVLWAKNYLDYIVKLESYIGQFSRILVSKIA